MAKVNPISDYPISPEALYIRDLLQRTLQHTRDVYDANGVPLPTRQYWCLGQAAEDCAQVVVVFINATLGLPGNQQSEPMPCNGPKYATIQVQVTRDIPQGPNGNPASPELQQKASAWPAVDASVLLDNLHAFSQNALGTAGSVLATVAVAPPSGFLQTTTLTLQLAMV